MNPSLEERIEAFDGSAVSILSEARAAWRHAPNYLQDVVDLCFDKRASVSDGATWILKAELEEGAQLSPELLEQMVHSLEELRSWQAQLHMCQLFEWLHCSADQADVFLAWVDELRAHPRPFLRAWSLHVQVLIGVQFRDHLNTATAALRAAEDDDAASVRSRVRRLRKLLSSG